jgi:hypothetical protein
MMQISSVRRFSASAILSLIGLHVFPAHSVPQRKLMVYLLLGTGTEIVKSGVDD